MLNVMIFVVLSLVTTLSYTQPITKEKISYEVQSAHNYIKSSLGSNTVCESISGEYIYDLTEAHDLFLKDSYLPALIKALNVTSLSARKSLGYLECRSRSAASIPHASLYLDYMLAQQNTPLPQPIPHQKTAPPEGDRAVLEALTDVINNRMVQACRASRCLGEEITIGYENNVIQKELMKEKPNYEAIAYWLSDIKGLIGTIYTSSNHTKELYYIHEKNTAMLRMIQPYVFQSQDFFGTFNRTLVNRVIHEINRNSYCAHVLAQFLEMTLDSSQHTLNRLIVTNNRLYERLNEAIYMREFYNTGCTISLYELFNTPFTFTEQIKKQLYAL